MLSRCCTQRRWCVPHEAAINLNVCSGRSRDNFNFHRWFVPGGEHSRIFPALRCRGGRGITRAASASRPIIGYRLARVLHRITQGTRRMANYRIALFVEDGYLVVMKNQTLAAFVIKEDNIVRLLLLIVHDDIGATLAKSLDDFSCLRSRATPRTATEATARSATAAHHLPRLTVGDEDPGLRWLTYVTRHILSVRNRGQQRESY